MGLLSKIEKAHMCVAGEAVGQAIEDIAGKNADRQKIVCDALRLADLFDVEDWEYVRAYLENQEDS